MVLSQVTPTESLWRMNQEYVLGLSRARSQVALLIRLLEARTAAPFVVEALRWLHSQLDRLYEEHRAWRYGYFYDTEEARRMVQDETDVMQALAHFARLKQRSAIAMDEMESAFSTVERPPHTLTQVAQGDLWELTMQALGDFAAAL